MIIIFFLIYKLLNSQVDQGSGPTFPGREFSYTERSQDQMSQTNTGKTIYVGNADL